MSLIVTPNISVMKNKRTLLFSLLISLFGFLAFIPREDGGIEKLVNALQRWTEFNPQEKIHLHMDKPYYALGDTIWFKAYITVGSRHQLSAMSGALYVELLDGRDSLIRELKLPVVSGTTYGDFTLDSQLQRGNYRIRAYTQWMRNFGEDYFFDRTFMVSGTDSTGSVSNVDLAMGKVGVIGNKLEQESSKELMQGDVRFFPESGNLINGIASKIGFKAIGTDGNSISIKGKVLDDLDKEIIDFKSLYAGMGSVVMKPEQGRTYRAKVLFPDSSVKIFDLPKPLDTGYVLSVYQPKKDSILVRIYASIANQTSKSVNLMVQSGGEIIFTSPIKITRSFTSIWLHKMLFPSGIAQFTLFNAQNEPLNERIAFIKSPDQMKLELNTAKKRYKSRELVAVDLTANGSNGAAVSGNFSVTVVNEDLVKLPDEREHTIFSDLLLTSEIKGYIEHPNYYFSGNSAETDDALDNLMLTQGYRRFIWKEILTEQPLAQLPFQVEHLSSVISGKVQAFNNKPIENGTVTLLSVGTGIIRDTTTDANGKFAFRNLVLTDGIQFSVQARTPKKSKRVEVIMDSIATIGRSAKPRNFRAGYADDMVSYIENSEKEHEDAFLKVKLNEIHRLKEVKIEASKAPVQRVHNLNGPDKYDQLVKGDDLESCATLRSCLEGQLRGVVFKTESISEFCPPVSVAYSTRSGGNRMLVVLDGYQVEPNDCSTLGGIFDYNDPSRDDIFSIEVLRSPNYTAVYGIRGSNGVILINTRRGGSRAPKYNPSIVNIAPRGFNKAREFYTPRYDRAGAVRNEPDLRSTIYWNPNVKTYATGKSSFNYFNADGPGNYKVIVEGINEHGELGRAVYRYEVEAATNVFQAQVNHSNSIVASLDSLQKRLPIEKVYLHTDKPYYNLGDTLWFKSYLLNATNFSGSSMSKFLYVELVDDSTEVVRRISVPVSDGLGWAQIPLSTNIFHEGAYTLRAYTNWMQNFGSDYMFTRRLYLGKPSINTWLVKSNAKINNINSQDQLEVNIQLKRSDNSPVGLKDVEIRVYEADKYLTKQELMTSQYGELKFSSKLKEKADGRNIRVEIRNMNKADGNQMLQVPLRINRSQFIDLQFLPEGGQLVAGLPALVGFKAIGEDGKGINVMGKIFDSSGAEAGSFASLHNGMGSFDFTPRPDDSYIAKIMLPEEVGKVYPLPVVNREGTLLRVLNNRDSVRIELAASNNAVDIDSVYYLLGTSRGKVYYSSKVDFSKARLTISKTTFPSGIARFTLLKGKRPLNERIIFIDHKDHLDIAIKPSKTSYLQRDSVSLSISVKDRSGIPVKGSFSMSVTDNSQVKLDSLGNYGIAASLLLNSDLKGTVEDPGYYLSGNDPQRLEALDNLMLTQGWTGYDWKDVFSPAVAPKFLAEKEFKVTGTVVNISNKPVSGAQVLISSQKPSFITTTVTDANGRYTFKDLPQIDSGSFFLQARTAKGRSMNFGGIDVERFQSAPVPPTFRDQLMPWYVNSDAEQLNYVQQMAKKTKEEFLKQSGVRLDEVKIVAKKIIKGSDNRNGPGEADLVFDEKDIKESGVMSLFALLKQKLPGIRVVQEDGFAALKMNRYMVVITIDGGGLPLMIDDTTSTQELREELEAIQIASFKGLEVMYSRKYTENKYANPPNIEMVGAAQLMEEHAAVAAGGGVSVKRPYYISSFKPGFLETRANFFTRGQREIAAIEITTGSKAGWQRIQKPDVTSYRPLPLMRAQEFYSPKYSINPADVAEPDLRSAIFWKPNIVTDANGTARVSFYSADIAGSYTVTLEGSGKDGNLGRKTITLKVGDKGDTTKR